MPTAPAEPHQVTIGSPDSDHISIAIVRRTYPEARDYWDGNWLSTLIVAAIGSFRARIDASLRTDELRAFRVAVERLYSSLTGEAAFESMETWLGMTISVDSFGHLIVRGHLVDNPGVGNRLEFEITGLDQTHLPSIIEELRRAEAAFPMITAP